MRKLKKIISHEEKSIMIEVQGQMYLRDISQENSTSVKRDQPWQRHKINMLEVGELWKLDSREEKSIMIEAQGKIYLMHVS